MVASKTRLAALLLLALGAAGSAAAQAKKEFRYTLGPGGTVLVYNEYGSVTVHSAPGRQVVVTATLASPKVEVDASGTGNRVELRTHALQRVTSSDGAVGYEVALPADANLNVRVMNGAITAENLHGDLTLVDDAGGVTVRNCSDGHVHVQTISGPVTLDTVRNGHVEITSVGGNVVLTNVSGRKVAVNTNQGSIRYDGNAGENGEYSLINNSGNIDFTAPASASMDLSARSINGSVQNDFPFQPKTHTSFAAQPGRAFAGTSHEGSSVIELRSFSGTIRVKKR